MQEPVYEQFARRLAAKTSALKLGWSRSWDVDMGSMISIDHAKKVLTQIDHAVSEALALSPAAKRVADLGPSFIKGERF